MGLDTGNITDRCIVGLIPLPSQQCWVREMALSGHLRVLGDIVWQVKHFASQSWGKMPPLTMRATIDIQQTALLVAQ